MMHCWPNISGVAMDHAVFGYVEPIAAMLQVDADGKAVRNAASLVGDDFAQAHVMPHLHPQQDDRILDIR